MVNGWFDSKLLGWSYGATSIIASFVWLLVLLFHRTPLSIHHLSIPLPITSHFQAFIVLSFYWWYILSLEHTFFGNICLPWILKPCKGWWFSLAHMIFFLFFIPFCYNVELIHFRWHSTGTWFLDFVVRYWGVLQGVFTFVFLGEIGCITGLAYHIRRPATL